MDENDLATRQSRQVKLSKEKIHVYSDSVLCCLGKIHEHPQATDAWKQNNE